MSTMSETYAIEPSRAEIDAAKGAMLLEFGAPWCGFCQAVQPMLAVALANRSAIRHVKIEDGKGKRLGRSFGVKLWPTLVFLKDGVELTRLVRPQNAEAIRNALAQMACPGSSSVE